MEESFDGIILRFLICIVEDEDFFFIEICLVEMGFIGFFNGMEVMCFVVVVLYFIGVVGILSFFDFVFEFGNLVCDVWVLGGRLIFGVRCLDLDLGVFVWIVEIDIDFFGVLYLDFGIVIGFFWVGVDDCKFVFLVCVEVIFLGVFWVVIFVIGRGNELGDLDVLVIVLVILELILVNVNLEIDFFVIGRIGVGWLVLLVSIFELFLLFLFGFVKMGLFCNEVFVEGGGVVVFVVVGFDLFCIDFVGVEVDFSSCFLDVDEVDIGRGLFGFLDLGWLNMILVLMLLLDLFFNGVFFGDFDVFFFWRDVLG